MEDQNRITVVKPKFPDVNLKHNVLMQLTKKSAMQAFPRMVDLFADEMRSATIRETADFIYIDLLLSDKNLDFLSKAIFKETFHQHDN